ncbi:hypothetical protein ASG87_11610 [Frateuria sp. Soil773]|uniref:hypothetical protein n=1 Tax=Frateuria sp. Soil773 TaxID=1736407 RepID=UPI0007002C4B|nr:hypothetical protein [Frateuria sp. Soil773]KRF02121.1 hypothetical protein ASG87_11610 [Frateuria sp. Soil773]
MWEELENGLEWFKAAPARWYASAKEDVSAAAEWIWNVLQGDFADDQSTAQVVTGTVISMIPFVDQICDVRDVVANCRKIHQDVSNKWSWVALILTLIGLFPVLGSLGKGCGKILFAYGRKCVFRAGVHALEAGFWQASRPWVEAGIKKLNQYLAMPSVRRTLKSLGWLNPYKTIAGKLRQVMGKLNVGELSKAFDKVIEALNYFVGKIQRWGSEAMGTKAGQLLRQVMDIRNAMAKRVEELLAPVRDWLEQLARRIELETNLAYRAEVNAVNPSKYMRPQLAADAADMAANKPRWVDEAASLRHKPMGDAPFEKGWPDISKTAPTPLGKAYKTFHNAKPVTIKPGEKLYRVVDPSSFDNSICWMREAEFKALKSRDDWRRRFAVWRYWNRNGEYATYVVPPGEGLRVWEGATASQRLEEGSKFVLEGGAPQIVLDPKQLKPEYLAKRKPTGWGYTDFPGESDEFLGLPKLANNIDPRNLAPDGKLKLPAKAP